MLDDVNNQRGIIDKEESASPTTALESVLLTSTINAEESRDLEIIDITNMFIQKRIGYEEYRAILCIRGKLV